MVQLNFFNHKLPQLNNQYISEMIEKKNVNFLNITKYYEFIHKKPNRFMMSKNKIY